MSDGTLDGMSDDLGYFGPRSVSWRVHREVTVLFGGARALLLQAAHPLVVAGANQTGMYDRNPWRRLQRTLVLTYTITFGTKAEAHAAADKINEVHARINGIDPVTGLPYDALDPELLLYVHACLVDSALLFEELTVGELDDRGRQRFHEEQMLAAELVKVPREIIPPTVPELRAWLAAFVTRGDVRVTEGARRVYDLFLHPPAEAEWRAILPGVSRLAFATLPAPVREMYGIGMTSGQVGGAAGDVRVRSGRCVRSSRRGSATWPRTTSGACGNGGTRSGPAWPSTGVRSGSDSAPRLRGWPTWRACCSTSTACSRCRGSRSPDRSRRWRGSATSRSRSGSSRTPRRTRVATWPRRSARRGSTSSRIEIVTAVTATASYLTERHPGAGVYVLTDGDPGEDLEGVAVGRAAGGRRRDRARRRVRRVQLRRR